MHPLFELLKQAAGRFGPALAGDTHRHGLAVTLRDGTTRAIPVTATPVILPAQEIQRRARASALLSSAALKMAQATLGGPDRGLLLDAMSPLERRLAEATFPHLRGLATTRVDYFVAHGRPYALEVNATIPAMQGYSDIAARGLIEHAGRLAGMDPRAMARLTAQNGSNADALHEALLEGYAAQREGARPERILLLCRRHDAQLTEQQYLARRFSELGTEAEVIHPDELSGEGVVRARGRTWDLVYRHLFARRLEEAPVPWVEQYFASFWKWKTVLLNPPSAQVEVKTTFALLDRALVEPGLAAAAGLTPDELDAVRTLVPWTRHFHGGGTVGPEGERVEDLVARVAREPSRFVLKRAWDYGGKAVFVGRALGTSAFEERVKASFGEVLGWTELCARAAVDRTGGGFVVQEYVENLPEAHLLCTPDGVHPAELHVDFSAYGSVQPGVAPRWGGVCRGSVSQIVNIVGGGGVLPLLTTEVADALHAALRASSAA